LCDHGPTSPRSYILDRLTSLFVKIQHREAIQKNMNSSCIRLFNRFLFKTVSWIRINIYRCIARMQIPPLQQQLTLFSSGSSQVEKKHTTRLWHFSIATNFIQNRSVYSKISLLWGMRWLAASNNQFRDDSFIPKGAPQCALGYSTLSFCMRLGKVRFYIQ